MFPGRSCGEGEGEEVRRREERIELLLLIAVF
jgi:hypothetical protein